MNFSCLKNFLLHFILLITFKCLYFQKTNCGLSINKLIVNGNRTVPNSWNWMVSLRLLTKTNFMHFCGGSLIDPQYVITAAHCVKRFKIYEIFIVAGLNNLNERIKIDNIYTLSNIYKHADWESKNVSNDIAILKLSRKVVLSTKIGIICLPPNNKVSLIYSKQVVTIGWGKTSDTSAPSNILMEARLTIINNQNPNMCGSYRTKNYCALDKSGQNSNSCYGDSGGPLMYYMNDRWYLYGITSFGISTSCLSGLPTFYTMVPIYVDWINKII